MSQLEDVLCQFPRDKAGRTRMQDVHYHLLARQGVSAELCSLATDPARSRELAQHLRDELARIAWFHHEATGANIQFAIDDQMNCHAKKGASPQAVECSEEWLQNIREIRQPSSTLLDVTPGSILAMTTTIERGTGGGDHCPFSTPPEFHGFAASPEN